MIPAEVPAIVAGLLAEPENPYVSTALEELTSDLPEALPLAQKIAFAAFEIYEALSREGNRRVQKASSLSGVRSADDAARGPASGLGSQVPPIAFASGD